MAHAMQQPLAFVASEMLQVIQRGDLNFVKHADTDHPHAIYSVPARQLSDDEILALGAAHDVERSTTPDNASIVEFARALLAAQYK